MNAEAKDVVLMTLEQRAVVALGQKDNEKGLVKMARQSKNLVAITNADGLEQVHAARMVLKNQRITIQSIGKAAREDATKFSKAIIAEENRLVALIQPEEERLAALQRAYEDKLRAEEEGRVQAELARVARHKTFIDNIRATVTHLAGADSKRIEGEIAHLKGKTIDGRLDEFEQEANDVMVATLHRLNELRLTAVAREAEARQIEADRKELARLRAEAEASAAAERKRREEQECILAAERAAHEAELTRRREELEVRERELRGQEALLARGRLAADVLNAPLASEPTTVVVLQDPPAPEPAPEPVVQAAPVSTVPETPFAEEIVQCVADHWNVSVAQAEVWIIQIGNDLVEDGMAASGEDVLPF